MPFPKEANAKYLKKKNVSTLTCPSSMNRKVKEAVTSWLKLIILPEIEIKTMRSHYCKNNTKEREVKLSLIFRGGGDQRDRTHQLMSPYDDYY